MQSPGPIRGRLAQAAVVLVTMALFAPLMPSASSQVAFADAEFSGSATGTVFHSDLLQSGDTRVENTDVAFSGATVNSNGLADPLQNELQRPVQPAQPDKNTYGRGSGLETGFGITPTDDPQIIVAGKAEAAAPPNDSATEEIGPLDADPGAWATLLRGQAAANWSQDTCVLGRDLSRGLGYASDVQLLDAGGDEGEEGLDQPVAALDHDDPARSVSQSLSRTLLVPQASGDAFGLASEVRQTIAPVTFFQGSANEFTIEFLGEWVLRAVATGTAGGAVVHYGPGEVSPETPILRTIDGEGTVTNIVTFQNFFDEEGLVITIPGVAEIALGEDPRAIGGDAESTPTEAPDGTLASGAVDVVRVSLLEQVDEGGAVTQRAAQVRVGHMETRAQVPQGGIDCGLPVGKSANPPEVQVGDEFSTPITVFNPFDCTLTNVRVTDEISTVQGARFTIVSTDPAADEVTDGENLGSGTIVWNDIGPIPPGESETVTARFRADAGGRIDDIARATAVLADCQGEGAAVAGVAAALEGAEIAGASPVVQVPATEVLSEVLPRTGPGIASTLLAGLGLLGLAGLGIRFGRKR